MTTKWFFKIIIASIFLISSASTGFAAGIGGYYSFNYDMCNFKTKTEDPTTDLTTTEDEDYTTQISGGGLVIDSNVAKDSIFNYRLNIGAGRVNKFTFEEDEDGEEVEARFKMYRYEMYHTFGFGLGRGEYARFWFGLQIGGQYYKGEYKDIDFIDFAGFGGTGGALLGLNLNFGPVFTLALSGGGRYKYTFITQKIDEEYVEETDDDEIETIFEGFEYFGHAAIIFRIGDTYSKRPETASSRDASLKRGSPGNIPGVDSVAPVDYSNLPRATLRQLKRNYAELREELFQGKLYPKKFFRVPRKLRKVAESNERVLLLKTKSGRTKILMLIPKDLVSDVKEKIRKRKALKFVYTPVDVYKRKRRRYPVIRFIDELFD